jgi:hypothetical protein
MMSHIQTSLHVTSFGQSVNENDMDGARRNEDYISNLNLETSKKRPLCRLKDGVKY